VVPLCMTFKAVEPEEAGGLAFGNLNTISVGLAGTGEVVAEEAAVGVTIGFGGILDDISPVALAWTEAVALLFGVE
jgi:hypothetical protein